MKELQHFKKVADYHKFAQISPPEHPLISLVDYATVRYPDEVKQMKWTQDYYTIGLKRDIPFKLFYGQQEYDFDEGVMTFIAPNQVLSFGSNPNLQSKSASGYLLLIHPDFLWNSDLAEAFRNCPFFGYSVSEGLFLSQREEQMMIDLFTRIRDEYKGNMDKFSQQIVWSHLGLLLNYAERFYERQFLTRKISNHLILSKLDELLTDYFRQDNLMNEGLPTVQWVADSLNLSANYLSSLLKSITGMNTQQHLHNRLIDKAKAQLTTTEMSVSEIAYGLGFEHPASFTKLFKRKTDMSPIEFRKSYN